MASHTRLVLKFDGYWSCGAQAKAIIAQYGHSAKTKADLIAATKALVLAGHSCEFWLFKERRLLPRNRSLYKNLCQYAGIGKHFQTKRQKAKYLQAAQELLGQPVLPQWDIIQPYVAANHAGVAIQGGPRARANQPARLAPAIGRNRQPIRGGQPRINGQ